MANKGLSMGMNLRRVAAAVAIAGAVAIGALPGHVSAAPVARQHCEEWNGFFDKICASDDFIRVYWHGGVNITHFNVRTTLNGKYLGQSEVSSLAYERQRKHPVPGAHYEFAVQACNRGGIFSSSTCGSWHNINIVTP